MRTTMHSRCFALAVCAGALPVAAQGVTRSIHSDTSPARPVNGVITGSGPALGMADPVSVQLFAVPDRSDADFNEHVTWELRLVIEADSVIQLTGVSGILDARTGMGDPLASAPLLGESFVVTPVDPDTLAFELTPPPTAVEGTQTIALGTITTDTVLPGTQGFIGEFSVTYTVGGEPRTISGVEIPLNSYFTRGPLTVQEDLVIRRGVPMLVPGDIGPFVLSYEAPDEFRGRDVRLKGLTVRLFQDLTLPNSQASLVGGSPAMGNHVIALNGIDVPLDFIEKTDLLTFDFRATSVGTEWTSFRHDLVLTVDGIPFEYGRSTQYTERLGIFADYGVEMAIDPIPQMIRVGREFDADASLHLPPSVGPLRVLQSPPLAFDLEDEYAAWVTATDTPLPPRSSWYDNIGPDGEPILDGESFEFARYTFLAQQAGPLKITHSGRVVLGEEDNAYIYVPGVLPMNAEPIEVLPLERQISTPGEPLGAGSRFGASAAFVGEHTLVVGEPGLEEPYDDPIDGIADVEGDEVAGRVRVLDVTDPAGPVVIASFSPADGSVNDRFGERIQTDGALALIASDDGVRLVDFSDPASPVLRSTFGEATQGFAIGAGYAVIGGDIFDISDPGSPVLVTELPRQGFGAPGLLDLPGSGISFAFRDGRLYGASIDHADQSVYARFAEWDPASGTLISDADPIVLDPFADVDAADLETRIAVTEGSIIATYRGRAYYMSFPDFDGNTYTVRSPKFGRALVFGTPSDGDIPVVSELITPASWMFEDTEFGSSLSTFGDFVLIGNDEPDPGYVRDLKGRVTVYDLSDPASPRLVADLPGAFKFEDAPLGPGDAFAASIATDDGHAHFGAPGIGSVATIPLRDLMGCVLADVAAPFGVLDLADISEFVAAFSAGEPHADLAPDGVFDLADIAAFVTEFSAGCP